MVWNLPGSAHQQMDPSSPKVASRCEACAHGAEMGLKPPTTPLAEGLAPC